MVDFRFYLNKQGIRGAKGETGDKGYSPEIVVDTETVNEYKLRIINETNEIVTPNLRGNTIDVLDPDGDIIKYNKNTNNFYVGTIDVATANNYGIVKLASEEDIISSSNNSVITPANISSAITENITSPDNSVHIFNNPETHKTELTIDTGSISGLETRVEHLEDDALYLENAVNDLSTGLANTNSNVSALNTSLNGVRSDLTTESQVRLNADTQQQEAIDAERQQREIQDEALQNQLTTKLTADNIKQGANVTITKDGNNVTINAVNQEFEAVWGSIAGNIEDQTDLKGQLDAIYDTIGNEVEAIDAMLDLKAEKANTYTKSEVDSIETDINAHIETVEDEVTALSERVDELQLYKFPNATIEGDPTINNGQVSNFSTTNYLRFPFEFKTEGRTWLLNGSFDTDSDVTTQQNIIDSLASVAMAVRNGRLVLALSTNGTSFNLGEHESMSDIEPNTKYYYRLSFSGTQYLLSISTDKQQWLPEIIVTSDQPIASKPMTISSPGHPFKGTINLNDYDLTVGNILVWQGMDDVGIASRMDVNASNATDSAKEVMLNTNGLESGRQDTSDIKLFNEVLNRESNSEKTGVDQIKEDDYTINNAYGTLVVDENKIATGFNGAWDRRADISGITLPATTVTKNIKFSTRFKFTEEILSATSPMVFGIGDSFFASINANRILVLSFPGSYFGPTWTGANTSALDLDTWYDIEGGQYIDDSNVVRSYVKWKKVADAAWKQIFAPESLISQLYHTSSNKTLTIGSYNNGVYPFIGGSVDLNYTKLVIDDELVYQSALIIPYTQSKTGSKIVDAIYKDRVNDAFDYNGEAIYYVLDKEKSTTQLPKGDIYGMITRINDTIGDVSRLLDIINGTSNVQNLAATPMLLSLENTELDIENSFTSNKSKAVFSDDIQITPLKEESYDDDTDIDLGGNE